MRCSHFLLFSGFCFPSPIFLFLGEYTSLFSILVILGRFLHARRPNSRPTAQWALVSWLFSLLTLETLDSAALFAGGLAAAALMEEGAATWLVHGGVLAFVLAANTYFLPPLPHLCPHHADLFIDPVEIHESARRISGLGTRRRGSHFGLTFDTRLSNCA